jgi:hypothetical protein
MENANPPPLSARWMQMDQTHHEVMMAFRGFNAYAEAFRKESDAHEK